MLDQTVRLHKPQAAEPDTQLYNCRYLLFEMRDWESIEITSDLNSSGFGQIPGQGRVSLLYCFAGRVVERQTMHGQAQMSSGNNTT